MRCGSLTTLSSIRIYSIGDKLYAHFFIRIKHFFQSIKKSHPSPFSLIFATAGFMRSVRVRMNSMFFKKSQEMSGNVRKWPEMVSKRSGNDILLAYINFKKCQICYHDRSAILNLNLVIFCILILFSHSPAFYISLNLVNLVFLVLVSNFLKLCLKHVSRRTLCLLSNHMCVLRLL